MHIRLALSFKLQYYGLMKLAQTLAHLFLPRQSNNHKARILHNSGLFYIKIFLILFQIGILTLSRVPGAKILGYAANIAPSEVIRLVNEKRAQSGLSPLGQNGQLASAALAKGTDMLNKDYWAHVAPDGTQPWKFFSDAGYSYRYAGENLARDFSNPQSAVEAWMASPTHRDNILSGNYQETGVAVIEGDLAGADTTIIVQLFGTILSGSPSTQPVAAAVNVPAVPTATPATLANTVPTPRPNITPAPSVLPTPTPEIVPSASPLALVQSETKKQDTSVLISPFNTTRGLSVAIVSLLLFVMAVDYVLTRKRKTARIGGRTFAHISFLGMILIIVLILRAGKIL